MDQMQAQQQTSNVNDRQPESLAEAYSPDEDVPLGGYSTFMAAFGGAFALFMSCRKTRSVFRQRLTLGDVLLLGAATHRLTRVLTRDWVTAPVRAPFVRYQEAAEGGEVEEEARGEGLRKATGQLLTCRFCTGPWVALGLVAAWLYRPQATRLGSAVFAVSAISDFLHHAQTRLKD